MARRIILAVIALLLVWFLWWGYINWRDGRALTAGDVVATDPDRPRRAAPDPPSSSTSTGPFGQTSTQPIVYPPSQQNGQAASQNSAAPPAADSISPNPPNGMVFAGTGHFQIYRQGNLTWRVNTDDGHACILFATDAEWRKRKVFRNGCGNP